MRKCFQAQSDLKEKDSQLLVLKRDLAEAAKETDTVKQELTGVQQEYRDAKRQLDIVNEKLNSRYSDSVMSPGL